MSVKRLSFVAVLAVAMAAASVPAHADNTTAASALHVPADGTTLFGIVYGSSGSPTSRWYVAELRGGRSYSVTLTADFTDKPAGVLLDVDLFAEDAVTPLGGLTDNADHAPVPYAGSTATLTQGNAGGQRYSFVTAGATGTPQFVFFRVRDDAAFLGPTESAYFRIALRDTTLFAPWFFTNANYEAFTQVMNASSASTSGTVTFYAVGTGAVCGTPQAFSLGGFTSTFIQAKGGAGCMVGGGVKITHLGPPGSIKANVTSVNATGVGLTHSFNMAFSLMNESPSVSGAE